MNTRALAAALAVVMVLAAAACSGGEPDSQAATTRPPTTAVDAAGTTTPSTSAEASPTVLAAGSPAPVTTRPAGGNTGGPQPGAQPPPPGTPPPAPPPSSPTAPTSPPPPDAGEDACSYALVAALRWYSFEVSLWLIEQVPDDPAPRQGLRERALEAAGIAEEGRDIAINPVLISALDRIASGYRAIADVALTGTVEEIAFAIASPQLESAMYDIDAVCQ